MKKLFISLLFLLFAISIYGVYMYNNFNKTIKYLESENDVLSNKISDLESENNNLERELEDLLAEKDSYESLYNVSVANYNDILETRSSNEYYKSDSNYNRSTVKSSSNKSNLFIDLPKILSTQFFDGGSVIKPSFGNLHSLMNMTYAEHFNNMIENDYSLTTDNKRYVSNAAANCCYIIDKEPS
tara:strand:+ start:3887 stop:4441 length:555 start_codon:yes stop_codon:yes gene_type:complete